MQTTKTFLDAAADALELSYRQADAGEAFDQVLDDLFASIDALNGHYFTERAETAPAPVPVQVAAARPVTPVPPRAPASGALKFAYRELDAVRASRRA